MARGSIHACRRSDCHLVMYDEDYALLDAIPSPLRDVEPTFSYGGSISHDASIKSNGQHVEKVARKNHLHT